MRSRTREAFRDAEGSDALPYGQALDARPATRTNAASLASERPLRLAGRGGMRGIPMATYVARQAADSPPERQAGSRPVPGPGVQDHDAGRAGLDSSAPADQHADRRGHAVVPADHHHRPARRGQDDWPWRRGRRRPRAGGLGCASMATTTSREPSGPMSCAALRRAGVAVPGALPAAAERGDGGSRIPAPAGVGAGRPGPAGDAGHRRPASADRAGSAGRPGLRAAERGAWPAAWWSPRGWTRCCRCTATGWPAS